MKALIVSHTFAPDFNGVAMIATQLAKSLIECGCEVTVATQYSPQRKSFEHEGATIEQFRIYGNAITGIKGEVARYQSFIENGNWDIQHHHACQIWGFDALLDWFPNRNRKVIVTPHGFSQLDNPAWEDYFRKLVNTIPHIDAFTCLSDKIEERDFLEQNKAKVIQTIPNGVVIADFEEANSSKDLRHALGVGQRFWILNVSNHVRTKGHKTLHWLAKAMPEYVVTNMGSPVAVEKYGLGKFGLKLPCYYDCQWQEKQINNYFTFQLPRHQVVAAYRQADLFVMPSEREAAPLVILEAMAAGLPWVASDVGNIRELSGGLVVNNRRELLEVTRELQNNVALKNKLAKEGRDYAKKCFNWNIVFEKYWQLYNLDKPL